MVSIPLIREPDAVDERVREAYRDIKACLRVPVVGSLFQAYAVVPRFLEYTWRRLRPNVLAKPFVERAHAIGALAQRGAALWPVGDVASEVRARGIGEGDLLRMREVAAMLDDVDPKLLVIAHAVRLAMVGGAPIGGAGVGGLQALGDEARLAHDYRGMIVAIIEERDAPLRVRTVYEEIKSTTGAAFVSGDYRAVAAFPDWLELWWRDVKNAMQSPNYAALCREVDDAAIEAARHLPYLLNLREDALTRVEISADERARVVRANDALCEMLPSVVVNMAVAHRGLTQTP